MTAPEFVIESVEGPERVTYRASGRTAVGIGRQADCTLRLDHSAVSRNHALLTRHAEQWFVSDLNSRHGTMLNGRRLDPGASRPVFDGDLLTVRPWTLRCTIGSQTSLERRVAMRDDGARADVTVAVFDRSIARAPTGRLLHLLSQATEHIGAAVSEADVRELILATVLEGSALERAALIRVPPEADSAAVLACRPERETDRLPLSRTLLHAARGGRVATLSAASTVAPLGESLLDAGVHTAVCAPAGEGVFLYLDAQSARKPVDDETAAFCGSLGSLYALADSNLRRAGAERRSARLNAQLDAAREVQRRLVPRDAGRCGPALYASVMVPGIVVAGDLFDIIELDDGQVGFFLGDVTGKGVGPSLTMAAAQASLHLALREHRDPAQAATAVNRFLAERSETGAFVTCWIGVIDPRAGEVRCVDAGHGYALLKRANTDQEPEPLRIGRGIPLGIDPEGEYEVESRPIAPGDRVVLFSDGVVEQTNTLGEQFTWARALAALVGSPSAEADVHALQAAVRTFSAGVAQGDDLTIGSIQLT
ncbi:MAG: FHA domain-containing protein [Phycisphaerales bacterium]|nr:MAG: FHA domain-containing protein [Phycisphaerales bacterium]